MDVLLDGDETVTPAMTAAVNGLLPHLSVERVRGPADITLKG